MRDINYYFGWRSRQTGEVVAEGPFDMDKAKRRRTSAIDDIELNVEVSVCFFATSKEEALEKAKKKLAKTDKEPK